MGGRLRNFKRRKVKRTAGITANKYEILEGCIRNTFGRVCWSHKIQESQAQIELWWYKLLEIIRVGISAILTCGLVSLLFTNNNYIQIAAALISALILFITGYFQLHKLPEIIYSHKSIANQLLVIRDSLQNLLMDLYLGLTPFYEIENKYNIILSQLHIIYENAPNTSSKAVDEASTALKDNRDNDITDSEIDLCLPPILRKVKK